MSEILFSDDLSDEELETLLGELDSKTSKKPVMPKPELKQTVEMLQNHESANLYDEDEDDWIGQLLSEDATKKTTVLDSKPKIQSTTVQPEQNSRNTPLQSEQVIVEESNVAIESAVQVEEDFFETLDDLTFDLALEPFENMAEPKNNALVEANSQDNKIENDDFIFENELELSTQELNIDDLSKDAKNLTQNQASALVEVNTTTSKPKVAIEESVKNDELLFDDFSVPLDFDVASDDTLNTKFVDDIDQESPSKPVTKNAVLTETEAFEAEFLQTTSDDNVLFNDDPLLDFKVDTNTANQEKMEKSISLSNDTSKLPDNNTEIDDFLNEVMDHNHKTDTITEQKNNVSSDNMANNLEQNETVQVTDVSSKETTTKKITPNADAELVNKKVSASKIVASIVASKEVVQNNTNKPKLKYLINSPESKQKAQDISENLVDLKMQINSVSQQFFEITNSTSALMKSTRELQSCCDDDFLITYEQMNELKKTISRVRKELSTIPGIVDIVDEALESDLYTAETRA